MKDNIATADKMQTTAGSLALVGSKVPSDSVIVQRMRAAGAIILGKANLSEWANFRGFAPFNGWSARGGFTRDPYRLDFDPCGSSSGSAVAAAANLCAIAVGTETDGSVVCPSRSPAIHCRVATRNSCNAARFKALASVSIAETSLPPTVERMTLSTRLHRP